MLLMEERHAIILEELRRTGSVRVVELSERMGVTPETIRKDLVRLESAGELRRVHGGAEQLPSAADSPIPAHLPVRPEENRQAKSEIAKRAFDLIPPDSAIIICSGTTCEELARMISLGQSCTVFTNSLPVALCLIGTRNKVFLFGGELQKMTSSVVGTWTQRQMGQIQANACFMGSDGFANLDGPSSSSSTDVLVNRAALAHAEKRYILADSSKSRRTGLHQVCTWSQVDALVTNHDVEAEKVARIGEQTQVILC